VSAVRTDALSRAAGARSEAAPWPSAARAWWAVFVLMITYMVALVDRQILSLLVVPLKESLSLSDTQVGLLQGLAFGVFYTLLGVPIGRLIDAWSRRNVIAIGCLLWCLATMTCGLAKSFGQLFLARVGVGVGEATVSPGSLSLLTDYFPPERRPFAISVYVAGGSLGAGAALIFGGAVIELVARFGEVRLPLFGGLEPWQSVFLIVGAAGFVAVALLMTVREPARQGVAAGDAVPGWAEFGAFLRERASLFALHFSGFALFSTLCYGMLAWAPTFFIRRHGWSASEIGVSLGVAIAVFGAAGVITGGYLGTRLRARGVADATLRTAAWGVLAISAPAALAPLVPDPRAALALYALATFFMAFPSGVSAAALQEVTPNRLRAQTSALYYFAINLVGLGLGPLHVALLTDGVFADEAHVGESLALSAAVLGPIGGALMFMALRDFRRWRA
jgi:MFS family permease